MTMRRILFAVMATIVLGASGTNVLWNQVGLADLSEFAGTSSYLLGADWIGNALPSINLDMGTASISATMTMGGAMGTWSLVSEGDILDKAFFRGMEAPLIRKTTAVYERNTQTSVSRASFYLGVQAETIDTAAVTDWSGNWNDPRIYTGEYVYGWVELAFDSENTLYVVTSAFDADGGPMIVGGGSATPEPSAVLLLLVGGAGLLLRRIRVST